jgi:hypothetical protein
MRYLITLSLLPHESSLEFVKQFPGFEEIEIDEDYGLVLISPKRNLYTIRVLGDLDHDKLMAVQPKVKGIHGDVRVAPIKP